MYLHLYCKVFGGVGESVLECPLPGPRWRWQQGVNCQSFLRVNILWQHHTGSTVNPVLGVNILSFTDEGESRHVLPANRLR